MHTGPFSSMGEYYRHGPYRTYVCECRSAGRTPIDLVRVRQPPGSFPDPPLPAWSILMVLQGVMRTRFCLGDKPFTRTQHPGAFVVAPPNTACDYDVDAPHEFLAVALPLAAVTSLVEKVKDNPPIDLGVLHTDVHRDPLLEQLCRRLFDEAAQCNPLGELFADHALVLLVSGLLRLANHKLAEQSCPGRLGGGTLRRVLNYVNDHLAGPISLADLAGVANLSEFHFARLFQTTMGVPPYQHVLRQRVERAQQLIRERRLSLAQIATTAGFSDQSHLTRHFKRCVGLTPKQFALAVG
jgi:AraC family transcriptional regulator